MTKEHLEKLYTVMNKIYKTKPKNLEIKHFFSGAAVYTNKKICITLTPKGLALKLPEELRTKLLKEQLAKPLRYFPKATIKKEYVVLSESITRDSKELNHLIKTSINYVEDK